MDIDDSFNVRVDLLRKPQAQDTTSCFQIQFCQLPLSQQLKVGDVLIQNIWFGVVQSIQDDINGTFEVGDGLRGPTVSKVLFSRSADFDVGDIVFGNSVWEKYTIIQDNLIKKSIYTESLCFNQVGPSIMEGQIALNAMVQAQIKPKQTVVITNASYGVGFMLLQLCQKSQDCNIIAIVDNEDQKSFISNFGGQILLKKDVAGSLKTVFNQLVNVIFDSEGGSLLDTLFSVIATSAKIILTNQRDNSYCGMSDLTQLVFKSASIQGVSKKQHLDKQLLKNIIPQFTIFDGIDKSAQAIQNVISGKAKGFTIVKVTRDSDRKSIDQQIISAQFQPKL